MPITYYVVVPFGRDDDGNLQALEPAEAPSSESAKRRAQALSAAPAGAVAFSRTGDPNTGDFGEARIIATYGEWDLGLLAE